MIWLPMSTMDFGKQWTPLGIEIIWRTCGINKMHLGKFGDIDLLKI